MVCLLCKGDTAVYNSRLNKKMNTVWRRRKCLNCSYIFTSIESVKYPTSIYVRDYEGNVLPFSRDKLFLSISGSLTHRINIATDAALLTDSVLFRLLQSLDSTVIDMGSLKQTIETCFNRYDKAGFTHYVANHSS